MTEETKFILDQLAGTKAKADLAEKGLLELLVFLVEKGLLTKTDMEVFSERLKKS